MKSNNTVDRRNLEDLVSEHNIKINETEERVRQLEQRAEAPSPFQPDLSGVEEVIKKAAEAGVIHALDYHTIRIENKTVHTWPDSLQTTMNSLMVLLKKNIETGIVGWKRKVQEWAVWGCCVLIAGIIIVGIIFFNSPQYWGTRYYKVCNHPLQQNEKLVERQYCAYEDVIHIFDNGRKDKKQMKAYIRSQEQQLKRREIEHGKGE